MVAKPPEKTIAPLACIAPRTGFDLLPLAEFTMLAAPPVTRKADAHHCTMGHRLSKIVTRTGDAGTTGLGDGSRVAKDSARIDAIGAVDELNSVLGVLLAEALPASVAVCLVEVQHDLFDLGGELSIPGSSAVSDAQVTRLERAIAGFNADLPPLKEFILPGGTRGASQAHVARTVCRRAERSLVHLGTTAAVADPVRKYVNRLSDLLFVLARVINRHAGCADVQWQKDRRRA
jgi:cob(I)alamin adenosyltransferase